MINAYEHKMLLEQITDLERGSINYFDVEKEFFLITSDNLADVQTKFYGYSIQRTGIYEEDNLTAEAIANLDGRGCYVYVEVKDGKITIKQDLNGSWGIYLFQHGDYFAMSNSFFRLLDHVKFKYPLTVNRDYFHHLFVARMYAHSKTAVNEVQRLDRSAIIHIDTTKKTFETKLIDYKEYTIHLDSEEGIATLDRWVDFWGDVFRGLIQQTNRITVELSGGFDSRVSFTPVLHSGIDLNKIQIFSIIGKGHTLVEDYKIASQIVEHYGFKLNNPFPTRHFINYSLSDTFNTDLYTRQPFDKISMFGAKKFIEKNYCVGGLGGEAIRGYWSGSPKEFIENNKWATQSFSYPLSNDLFNSTKKILSSTFQDICDKYKIEDSDSEEIIRRLYVETACPTHFGNNIITAYFNGKIYLSSMIDPYLRTLNLKTSQSSDSNLLVALLFIRYAPDLLTFPFNSGHSIKPETVDYAKKINERFPRRPKDINTAIGGGYFHLSPHDKKAEQILAFGRNNPEIPGELPQTFLKAVFESSRAYGLFTAYFDAELYYRAVNFYENNTFGRDRLMYAIVGITRVLEDVEISQSNLLLNQNIKHFIEKDFCLIYKNTQTFDKFKPYLTARVDIAFETKSDKVDFQLNYVSDREAKVFPPAPIKNRNGIVYRIHSWAGNLELVAKAAVEGKIKFWLRGLDIRKPEDNSKRIPHWIDYTKLTVNDKKLFDTLTPAWHDKPYNYNFDVKAGEEIKIQVEWLPHRSDT